FFAEQVAGPLDADFHIGLAAEHDHRVAPVVPPPQASTRPGQATQPTNPDLAARRGTTPNPPVQATDANTTAWRRAELPAVGGHGNARSVGLVQAVLAGGGTAGGVRLLSEATCELVLAEQYRGLDRCLGRPMRWGLGY
nr:hypothetical protein [Micromonospora sp. DSM 115978]